MEVLEGECSAPFPGVFLFTSPNPEVGEEKGEKRELGPVDPLKEKGEEKGEKRELGPVDPLEEKGKAAGTSIAKTPADSDGESQRGGPFSDRSGDRSSDRSPGNKRVEQTKSSRSLVSINGEETQEEEIRRQVDSYRAIDRSGPVRGPVRDRSSDSSGHRYFRATTKKEA